MKPLHNKENANERVCSLVCADLRIGFSEDSGSVNFVLGRRSVWIGQKIRAGRSVAGAAGVLVLAAISYLVFEVPPEGNGLKLWLRSTHDVDALLWGDERSTLHGKVLFLLNTAPATTKSL